MNLMLEDLMNYWYLWTLAVLFFGFVSFGFGFTAVKDKKSMVKSFLPLLCVELIIAAYSALCVNEWIGMGASFHWVIYEHAPKVYLAVIALVFIPLGYLAGMIFARKRA